MNESISEYGLTPCQQYLSHIVARTCFNREARKGFRPDENIQNQSEPTNMIKDS